MPEQYDGYPVMARVDAGGQVLYQAGPDAANSLTTDGVTAEAVNACSTLDHTAGSFRIPGSFLHYDLTRLGWEDAGASVTIPVEADLEQAAYLQLDLAQDSGDARNRQQDQSLTVTLRDAAGKEASMQVPAARCAHLAGRDRGIHSRGRGRRICSSTARSRPWARCGWTRRPFPAWT